MFQRGAEMQSGRGIILKRIAAYGVCPFKSAGQCKPGGAGEKIVGELLGCALPVIEVDGFKRRIIVEYAAAESGCRCERSRGEGRTKSEGIVTYLLQRCRQRDCLKS